MIRLDGKVAIVTGGTGGIGRGVAEAYGAAGAKVVVSGRNETEGKAVVARIEAQRGTAHFHPTDVSRESEVEGLIRNAADRYGRLDIAFNGAGVASLGPLADLEESDFDRIFAINVKGLWLCMKHEIRQFLAQGDGGVIVNAGSVQGHIAFGGSSHYTATKHAVSAYTRSGAKEYAKYGIRINQIAPGLVNTPLIKPLFEKNPALRDERLTGYPIGRFAEVEDIVGSALFLASDLATYVNGISLPIDGGYLVS
jgi:NAD(P)-dependent dehydrogenase (short-subunit alcohol dehydrogenase family)